MSGRRSGSELQRVKELAEGALLVDPRQSDRCVGKRVGLDHKVVNRVRRALEAQGRIEPWRRSGRGQPVPADALKPPDDEQGEWALSRYDDFMSHSWPRSEGVIASLRFHYCTDLPPTWLRYRDRQQWGWDRSVDVVIDRHFSRTTLDDPEGFVEVIQGLAKVANRELRREGWPPKRPEELRGLFRLRLPR